MDRRLIVERHRNALIRIVAGLFVMVGLGGVQAVERLPRRLHRAVLGVLRPAESAVRRLIVVVAAELVVRPTSIRAVRAGLRIAGTAQGRRSFQLFDPPLCCDGKRRRFRSFGPEPRIHALDVDYDPRVPLFRSFLTAAVAEPESEPDSTVSAVRLSRRLAAIRYALDDLPRQARRYARWRAKPFEARRPKLISALRPGAPPGSARRTRHAVDMILEDCNWLAHSLPAANTS